MPHNCFLRSAGLLPSVPAVPFYGSPCQPAARTGVFSGFLLIPPAAALYFPEAGAAPPLRFQKLPPDFLIPEAAVPDFGPIGPSFLFSDNPVSAASLRPDFSSAGYSPYTSAKSGQTGHRSGFQADQYSACS